MFLSDKEVISLKQRFSNWENKKFPQADEILIPLLKKLNQVNDIAPIFSCEGHQGDNTPEILTNICYVIFGCTADGYDKLISLYHKFVPKAV